MAVALTSYAPFDAGPGASNTESRWRDLHRYIRGTDTARNGVLRGIGNEGLVYGDSTGLWVKVKAGEFWAEGHWGQTTTDITVPVTPNSSGSTRVDRVVCRANYVTNQLEFDCVAGASPTTPPARTSNSNQYELSLASVSVANGAATIAAANVFDGRDYIDHPELYARCTADTTRNNSTALLDITSMSATGSSSAIYAFEAWIEYSATTGADLGFRLVTPTGATARMNNGSLDFLAASAGTGPLDFTTQPSNITLAAGAVGTGTKMTVQPRGWITMPDVCGTATVPMTIKMQMTQGSAEASNCTVYSGSWFRLSRMA